ncbi:MAG TPA: alpha/beta hydrolase [Clostridia bacterium]|nr:alpha/beta hydrolase [Clostridia bacterium]
MKLAQRHWQKTGKFDKIRLDKQPTPENVNEQNDIPYLDDGHKYHMLDVYRPSGARGKLPVIMDIHGGGWYYGDKELNKKFCMHLAALGFAVVNISYRLAPEVTYNKQLDDCFAALNWIEKNAESYELDANNIFLVGDSAGGHLASLMANIMASEKLQEVFNLKTNLKIKAIGFICPAFDITKASKIPFSGILYLRAIFGKGYKRSKYFSYADFTANISEKMPPSFIISCYGDFLKKTVLSGYGKMKQKGVECELHFYETPTNSGNALGHVFNVSQPLWQESIEANKKMIEFFTRYID